MYMYMYMYVSRPETDTYSILHNGVPGFFYCGRLLCLQFCLYLLHRWLFTPEIVLLNAPHSLETTRSGLGSGWVTEWVREWVGE